MTNMVREIDSEKEIIFKNGLGNISSLGLTEAI